MPDPGRFVEVADLVFVARYRQWDVSVGLVVGRTDAVIVDTRASRTQGGDLLEDIRRLGLGVEVTQVVNTHVHFDHTFGNVAFQDATVHAHDNVAAGLVSASAGIKELIRGDLQDAPEYGYTVADLREVLTTQVRGPDRTFADTATLDLGGRSVELVYAGRGHTDGDIAIRVSDAQVVFIGDLVEESAPPSFGDDSWPLDWPETLLRLTVDVSAEAVVVPGHGRRVDGTFVRRQCAEIDTVAALIRERHAGGMALADALREPDSRLPYPLEHLESAFARGYAELDHVG